MKRDSLAELPCYSDFAAAFRLRGGPQLFKAQRGRAAAVPYGVSLPSPTPANNTPANNEPANSTPARKCQSLAETKWFDLFHDDTLTELVNTAIRQNFDLRIAAERVLEAQAQAGITNAARSSAMWTPPAGSIF